MNTKSTQLFNCKEVDSLGMLRHSDRQSSKSGLSLTGFTLIELLVVVAIILIIAGMVVGVSGPASKSAKNRKAEVMISALEVAIGMYKADMGVCPVTDGGTGCQNLYNGLVKNTSPYAVLSWHGPYMEFKSGDLMGIDDDIEIKDPWGRSYNYQTVQWVSGFESFDLWSCGADGENDKGTAGTNPDDDIKNW